MIDCSKFSPYRFWWVGVKLKEQGFNYLTVALQDDFDDFVDNRKISATQLSHFRDGMTGKPYVPDDDVLMPFGKYLGQSIGSLEMKYIVYLTEQVWINKYPTVASWLKRKEKDIETYKSEHEQGMRILADFKQTLQ